MLLAQTSAAEEVVENFKIFNNSNFTCLVMSWYVLTSGHHALVGVAETFKIFNIFNFKDNNLISLKYRGYL